MGNRHSPPPPPPPPPPPRRYVNPSNYVREGPYLYATMRNENPGSHNINCLRNTGVFWLPTGGWEISPEDNNAIEATRKHGWGTHVVAYNNGCGRGTATYSLEIDGHVVFSIVTGGSTLYVIVLWTFCFASTTRYLPRRIPSQTLRRIPSRTPHFSLHWSRRSSLPSSLLSSRRWPQH